MTVDQLRSRLAEFTQRHTQAIATTNALGGAVQMLEGLIADEEASLSPQVPAERPGPQLVPPLKVSVDAS